MKWIYRILRLFFCPHNYRKLDVYEKKVGGRIIGYSYVKECVYCGEVKEFEI